MPGGDEIRFSVSSKPRHVITVGVHRINVAVAVAQALKNDFRSVRRPVRENVLRRAARDVRLVAAVGVHRVYLEITVPIAVERDLGAVGRPGRVIIESLISRQEYY